MRAAGLRGVKGGGEVYLTTARVKSTMDFDVGRLYYISIEGARPDAVLEWRILGSEWGPVPAGMFTTRAPSPYGVRAKRFSST